MPTLHGPRARCKTLVKQVGSEVHGLGLNFYQRAKLANAFKWKLIENGVEKKVAHEVTQFLVVDISAARTGETARRTDRLRRQSLRAVRGELFARANRHAAAREYDAAIEAYRAVLNIDPRHTAALNNLGSALLDLGRFIEAEQHFRGGTVDRSELRGGASQPGRRAAPARTISPSPRARCAAPSS